MSKEEGEGKEEAGFRYCYIPVIHENGRHVVIGVFELRPSILPR